MKAGPLARIARVGHAPLGGDDPIELRFANGAIFHVDIGFEHATDVRIDAGTLLERAYGHLRVDDPAAFAAIARDWTSEDLELPWAVGAFLANPRRLAMTKPYRVNVGYAFDARDHILAVLGEADFVWVADFNDDELAGFGLEIGARV